jgi:hypothetical protein
MELGKLSVPPLNQPNLLFNLYLENNIALSLYMHYKKIIRL